MIVSTPITSVAPAKISANRKRSKPASRGGAGVSGGSGSGAKPGAGPGDAEDGVAEPCGPWGPAACALTAG